MKIIILIILSGIIYSKQIFCSDTTDLKCYTIDRSIKEWRIKDTTETSVVESSTKISNIKSYPNPTKDEIIFAVDISLESDCIISIDDINGRRLKTFPKDFGQNIQQLTWDLKTDEGDKVVTGTYFLKILSARNIFTHRFIIEK